MAWWLCILIESISWIDKILAIMNAMKATHYYNKASQVLGPLYIKELDLIRAARRTWNYELFFSKNWQLAGTLGIDGIHASFLRKANENVQVAVELEASLRALESVTTLAYQFDLPKMNLVFKGKFFCFLLVNRSRQHQTAITHRLIYFNLC